MYIITLKTITWTAVKIRQFLLCWRYLATLTLVIKLTSLNHSRIRKKSIKFSKE